MPFSHGRLLSVHAHVRGGDPGRPIHLEPIAHEFPAPEIVAAHLGACWNEECATLCRMCPRVYADEVGASPDDHERIFDAMGWSEEPRADVLREDARRLFEPAK